MFEILQIAFFQSMKLFMHLNINDYFEQFFEGNHKLVTYNHVAHLR